MWYGQTWQDRLPRATHRSAPPPPPMCLCPSVAVCVAFAQSLEVSHGRPRWDLRTSEEGATAPLHERMTIAVELAAATHHSSPMGGWDATHNAPRGQKSASSVGARPAALREPVPQLASEHAACPAPVVRRPCLCRSWQTGRVMEWTPPPSASSQPLR